MDAGLFAQLQTVDPGHLKDFVILAIAGLAVGAQIATFLRSRNAQRREVSFAEEFVPKTLHEETKRRLEATEKQISELWTTLRSETESIRDEIRIGLQSVARSLGRLEGRIGGRTDDKEDPS